jgi:hypothetical protein
LGIGWRLTGQRVRFVSSAEIGADIGQVFASMERLLLVKALKAQTEATRLHGKRDLVQARRQLGRMDGLREAAALCREVAIRWSEPSQT